MLTIEIQNDGTESARGANYDYWVKVNGQLIHKGRIEGHRRVLGWEALVDRLAKAVERDKWEGIHELIEAETKPDPVEWR